MRLFLNELLSLLDTDVTFRTQLTLSAFHWRQDYIRLPFDWDLHLWSLQHIFFRANIYFLLAIKTSQGILFDQWVILAIEHHHVGTLGAIIIYYEVIILYIGVVLRKFIQIVVRFAVRAEATPDFGAVKLVF